MLKTRKMWAMLSICSVSSSECLCQYFFLVQTIDLIRFYWNDYLFFDIRLLVFQLYVRKRWKERNVEYLLCLFVQVVVPKLNHYPNDRPHRLWSKWLFLLANLSSDVSMSCSKAIIREKCWVFAVPVHPSDCAIDEVLPKWQISSTCIDRTIFTCISLFSSLYSMVRSNNREEMLSICCASLSK